MADFAGRLEYLYKNYKKDIDEQLDIYKKLCSDNGKEAKDFIGDVTLYNEDSEWPLGVSAVVDKIREEIKSSFPQSFNSDRKTQKRKYLETHEENKPRGECLCGNTKTFINLSCAARNSVLTTPDGVVYESESVIERLPGITSARHDVDLTVCTECGRLQGFNPSMIKKRCAVFNEISFRENVTNEDNDVFEDMLEEEEQQE